MKAVATYLLALGTLVTSAHAGSTLTVVHGEVATPTYIDLGAAGQSVGDQRIWHYDGQDDKSAKVTMDWVMTTTATTNTPGEFESRITLGIFTFASGAQDRILLQGIGLYPPSGSTLKAQTTLERAIIGGSGQFSGASGSVVSTHLDDGTWKHEFRID
jgi:hypothetical protein